MNKRIEVTRPSMPPYEEYIEEIKSIWETKWLTNFGPLHSQLALQLAEFLGVPAVSLFTNGHQALYTVLSVMELSGEVITTPFTFASTTHAIAQCGLSPVFCDVDPVTYTMDPDKIEALITEKTCAIMPVHVYGTICDTEKIQKIADRHGLPVIYDAAHAFGVTVNGKGAGNFGDAAIFSLHATKAYNSVEGGAAVFRDAALAEKARSFINFGLLDGEYAENTGTNAKMNEFAAAMGICNLRHIDDVLAARKRICEQYKSLLFETDPDFDPATGISPRTGMKMLPAKPGVSSNYAYFPVLFDPERGCRASRDEVKAALEAENIRARRYFYPLTSEFACYRTMRGAGETETARHLSECVLALPLYADLTPDDVSRICAIISQAVDL